jgi:hypothetical protein
VSFFSGVSSDLPKPKRGTFNRQKSDEWEKHDVRGLRRFNVNITKRPEPLTFQQDLGGGGDVRLDGRRCQLYSAEKGCSKSPGIKKSCVFTS